MRASVTFVGNATAVLRLGSSRGGRPARAAALELTELIRPRLTVLVHFDDYQVMKSPLSAFLTRARDQGLTGIKLIARGSTLDLPLRIG